jgi:hypothetical protein
MLLSFACMSEFLKETAEGLNHVLKDAEIVFGFDRSAVETLLALLATCVGTQCVACQRSAVEPHQLPEFLSRGFGGAWSVPEPFGCFL